MTGHLTHFTVEHLFWDVVGLVVLGVIIERRSRWALLWTLGASAAAITAYLLAFAPDVVTYRGLSGLDSALLVCAALQCMRQRPISAAAALLGFLGKVGVEIVTGQMLFAQDLGGATGLPAVHLVGAVAGLMAGAAFVLPRGAWLSAATPRPGYV